MLLLSLSALVSVALALPSPDASCTFTSTSQLASGKGACSSITLNSIAVPAGQSLDLTGLKSGTQVTFSGTTTFGYKEWEGPLINAGGSISIQGASGHVIDCGGARWWDGKGSNGGKTKPKFFAAHSMTNAKITGLSVKNTPVQAFSINSGKGVTLDHITIDNRAGDSAGGHNTDAFDVGSSDSVFITNSTVYNQDDCLAVNSGTNIHFTGALCSGGHGISIGSVGGRSDNTVDGVTIENCQVKNSDNGVRIKTVYGAIGRVNNVSYSKISLSGIAKYGIVIEQDYENGSPSGKPTTGVPITGLTLSGVTGSVSSSATDIYILCGSSSSCSDWKWSGVSLSGGKKSASCKNVPSSASC